MKSLIEKISVDKIQKKTVMHRLDGRKKNSTQSPGWKCSNNKCLSWREIDLKRKQQNPTSWERLKNSQFVIRFHFFFFHFSPSFFDANFIYLFFSNLSLESNQNQRNHKLPFLELVTKVAHAKMF